MYVNIQQVCPAKWEEGSESLQPGLDLVGKSKEALKYA